MLSSLLVLICVLSAVHGQCKWDVILIGAHHTLDLTCAEGKELTTQDTSGHSYQFTLCANSASCNGEDVMVSQSGEAGCFILGRWDTDVEPEWSSASGGSFTFKYQNGDTDCGNPARTWAPTFVCQEGTEWEVGTVNEVTGSCFYTTTIYTKYACDGNTECSHSGGGGDSGSDSAETGLSGGWIFIIILLGALFLYFVVGYIVMATTVNKQGGFGDFANNIPNKAIWVACPSLVIAGCMVSKEAIMNVFNKGKGGDGLDEPIGNDTE
eukprot:CAMPEP_0197026742 /NCGR_PEP_ID=MMETSP1384-20130603/6769_1 /TAXON_ID=29189 /ORGANISM="Ammonia sp." /LENGTH=266 /DNA_ID=CAMNT_0042455463 /DNA_START=90 /DNA_END=890 /DNA_ORIENTATION=+